MLFTSPSCPDSTWMRGFPLAGRNTFMIWFLLSTREKLPLSRHTESKITAISGDRNAPLPCGWIAFLPLRSASRRFSEIVSNFWNGRNRPDFYQTPPRGGGLVDVHVGQRAGDQNGVRGGETRG